MVRDVRYILLREKNMKLCVWEGMLSKALSVDNNSALK